MTGDDAKAVISIAKGIEEMLGVLGEEPGRDGLQDTPSRVARMYLEMTSGLREEPPKMKLFQIDTPEDQMITVLHIDYYSMCEHHLVPFFGRVHIGYIPTDKIVGLSKLARVVEWASKRPQVQERLTSMIADYVNKSIQPKGIIVVVEGTHLCMAMRGIRKPNHVTITSAIRGEIAKEEFFDILKLKAAQ